MGNVEFEIPPSTHIEPVANGKIWFHIQDTSSIFIAFDEHGNAKSLPYTDCQWHEISEGAEYRCDEKILLRLINGILYTGDFYGTWNDVIDQLSKGE